MRGGKAPNYDKDSVSKCEEELKKAGLPTNIMIDCSHGNSNKNHENQGLVLEEIAKQIEGGNRSIIGVMIESNLNEGNQPIPDDLSDLSYGVSVTDACISWESTEELLRSFAKRISASLKNRI